MAVLIVGRRQRRGSGDPVASPPRVATSSRFTRRQRRRRTGLRRNRGARRQTARDPGRCRDAGGARDLIRQVAERTDRLDLIVHGAVTALAGPLLGLDPAAFAQAISSTAASLVYLVRPPQPLIRRGTSIVFLSSRGSRQIVPTTGPSAPARRSPSRSCATSSRNSRRSACASTRSRPARSTPRRCADCSAQGTDAFLASEAAGNPSGRNIVQDDYAALVAFLAGPEASMIQGQVVFVNGGQYVIA